LDGICVHSNRKIEVSHVDPGPSLIEPEFRHQALRAASLTRFLLLGSAAEIVPFTAFFFVLASTLDLLVRFIMRNCVAPLRFQICLRD
jgi:hypothetical protein